MTQIPLIGEKRPVSLTVTAALMLLTAVGTLLFWATFFAGRSVRDVEAQRSGALALENAGWEEIGSGSASDGGISDNDGSSSDPAVTIAPDGTLYVAWHDDSSEDRDDEIYVRRWNESSWEEVGYGSASGGGISDNDSTSRAPSMAIAPDSTLYIAWHDNSGEEWNYEIYVRRWDGGAWVEVGTGSATGGGISDNSGHSTHPSMATATNGTPYVAWCDDSNSSGEPEIYVRRWDGNDWVEVGTGSATGGGISNNSGISVVPSMAIAPDGTPYVAWSEYTEIYVRRWNGSHWEEVGAGSATGGGISDSGGWSFAPSAAVAPDGTPYIAWEDADNKHPNDNGDIYVRRWNGSHWEEVGASSASGGGISNNSGDSEAPSVIITPDGAPYVAWEDDDSGDREVYVRRWNNNSWEEVGEGSASDGGISDSNGESQAPSVAVAPDGTPYVAWSDYSSGNREIYVRRGPPELEIAPVALTFLAEVDGANPEPRNIVVKSTGRAITWTATVSPAASWLNVAPISGTTPATITTMVNISGLGTHLYPSQIVVDAGEDVIESPQTIEVKLIVAEEIHRVCLPLILRRY